MHASNRPPTAAPRRADPGEPGEEATVALQLKLIADAGLVGLPNAGKSTMLSAVSGARPKIADYPLHDVGAALGVVELDHDAFVMADIPGLIEGAHEGAGLGDRFLRHVERCRILLHLVDGTGDDVASAWRTVRDEVVAYGGGLGDKPEILALNKADALIGEERDAKRAALEAAADRPVAMVSGVTGEGVQDVLRQIHSAGARSRTRGGIAMTAGLSGSRRIVVKIGSVLLVDEKRAAVHRDWLDALADDIAGLRGAGSEIVIVSSGANRARPYLARPSRPSPPPRGEAGGRGDRASAPGACLPGGARPSRHHRRADPGDARRYRSPAASPQRPVHDRGVAGSGGGSVINENDTVATEGNPLRGQ